MAVEILSIKNAKLQQIAYHVDANKDGNLSGEEYSVFSKEAMSSGATYKEVSDALNMNALQRWWFDVDKVSTDGKDDGKLSLKDKFESIGKGIANLIKVPFKHPIATLATIGAAGALTVVTGGAALPLMVGAGVTLGGVQIGSGVLKALKAKTDADAKTAYESIGTGAATLALSGLGVKSANKAAAKSGVEALQGLEEESWVANVKALVKAIPSATKQSGLNLKDNILTLVSALKGDKVIYANSNIARKGVMVAEDAETSSSAKIKIVPKGTKYMGAEGEATVQPKSVIRIDSQGRLYQSTVESVLKEVKLSDAQLEKLSQVDPVAVELYRNPNGILSRIPVQYRESAMPIILDERDTWKAINQMSDVGVNPSSPTKGSIKFDIVSRGGREVIVKNKLLNVMGVRLIYGSNDYNGASSLFGFSYNGKNYSFGTERGLVLGQARNAIDGIFDMINSGKLPEPVTEFPEGYNYYLR